MKINFPKMIESGPAGWLARTGLDREELKRAMSAFLLDTVSAANALGLAAVTMRKHAQRGTIPATRIGKRVLVFDGEDLVDALDRNKPGNPNFRRK